MTSLFCHLPVVDVFFQFNSHFLASKGRVIQISGGICANLHTIPVLVGGTATDSSSEPHES
jgi:hypothetical protein